MNRWLETNSSASFKFSSKYSSPAAKWVRRSKTIPALVIAFTLTWLLFPVLLLVAFFRDALKDKTLPTVRLVAFGAWWLFMELLGVFTAFCFWLIFAPLKKLDSDRSQRWHSRLQGTWARSLAWGAKFTIRLRWTTEGLECLQAPGPIIVLARHGSQGDALLAAALLSGEGRRLRFILKQQLLTDPCLDVVGHRIPNYFVNRDSTDNREELDNIKLLAKNLDQDEALIIFPEGTRFSPEKLASAIKNLHETNPLRTASVTNLRSVLPVRVAGTLAVLSASTADIVMCNHVGISDISSLRQLRAEVPLRNPLRFKLSRVPRKEVPAVEDQIAVTQWLDDQWLAVDEWVTNSEGASLPKAGN